MTRGRRRRARAGAATRLLLALLCLASLAGPAHASKVKLYYEKNPGASEMELKAAFLLKFPDFVDWRSPLGDTLRVGVAGDESLRVVLTRLADEQNRMGPGAVRMVSVFRVDSPEAARRCHILVLGESSPAGIDEVLRASHQAGALSVGIWKSPRGGAVIRLFREGNRVRFDVSQTLARDAGLRISSKLLNLAREQTSRIVPWRGAPSRG
jgi:hypothetical protein